MSQRRFHFATVVVILSGLGYCSRSLVGQVK